MAKDHGENKPDIYGLPTYDDWANSTEYKQFDRVNFNGAVYAARKANSGVNPFFDDGETWEHISGVAFVNNDTMDVETVNGTMVSGRKVNASGGIGSNVNSAGLNIYGIKASKDSYGVVKVGDGINIDDGVISAEIPQPYSLPIAKADRLGGVKIGNGVNIAYDGTISITNEIDSEWIFYKQGAIDDVSYNVYINKINKLCMTRFILAGSFSVTGKSGISKIYSSENFPLPIFTDKNDVTPCAFALDYGSVITSGFVKINENITQLTLNIFNANSFTINIPSSAHMSIMYPYKEI